MQRALIVAMLCLVAESAFAWEPTAIQRQILEQPRSDTKFFLALTVSMTGYSCSQPKDYRRYGLMPTDGSLIYLIDCGDGQYVVQIPRDRDASPLVMDCDLYAASEGRTCAQIDPAWFDQP